MAISLSFAATTSSFIVVAAILLSLIPNSHGVRFLSREMTRQPSAPVFTPNDTQEDVFPTLTLGTDEVHVTFHALDAAGQPVIGLSSQDFQVHDNGKTPLKLLSFEHSGNLPSRAGILFDTSRSMSSELRDNRATANIYASKLLRSGIDRAFLMRFDFDSKVLQNWTDASPDLEQQVDNVGNDYESRMGGTKLYDSVYKACRDQWQERPVVAAGNFILLFSDGLDNASNSYLGEVVEMCQQRRVAVFVVTREPKVRSDVGQRVLNDLSAQTGGAMIFAKTESEVAQALSTIQHTVDDRYTVVYKPRLIKRDGKFHKLHLECLQHCSEIKAPSGYYAPR